LTVNSCIKQNIEVIDDSLKESRIVKLLENITDGSKILIFCQTKRGCDRLADVLKREKYQAISIHGDKSQSVKIPFFVLKL
jgi:ATP-dependent RNA helicase DDX5/DBP2